MTAPKRLYAIAIVFLLWSLLGNAAFVMDLTQDINALAKTDVFQAQILRTTPLWAWAAYAIAVWAGLLASIALLLRRKIAVPLYAVSLIATIIQFGHTVLGTDTMALRGLLAVAPSAFDVSLGIAQVLYSRSARAKDWLR